MKCISLFLAALGNCNSVFGEAIEFPIAFKRTAEQEHKAPAYSDKWCENEPLATDEPFIDPDLIPKWHIPINTSLPISVTKVAPGSYYLF